MIKGGGKMDDETRGEGGGTQGEGGVGWQWGTLCSALSGVAVGEGDMIVASSHGKRLEEREHAFPLCSPRSCE
jgi:hypothetical protein